MIQTSSSSVVTSDDGLGSIGDLIDVDQLSDTPLPLPSVSLLEEESYDFDSD